MVLAQMHAIEDFVNCFSLIFSSYATCDPVNAFVSIFLIYVLLVQLNLLHRFSSFFAL